MTTTTPEPLENKVNQLESALGRLAELSFSNAQRHDNAINRMEDAITNLANTVANNNTKTEQAITNLINTVTNLTNTVANLATTVSNNNARLDAIAVQSAAERETFIAEIREIWRYLRYQPGNGRSGHDDA